MRFKAAPTERLVRRVVVQVGITYVLVGIFAVSATVFEPRLRSRADLAAALGIGAVLLVTNLRDFHNLRVGHLERFAPYFVLAQACGGILALALFVRSVGAHHGTFVLLVVLPVIAVAVIGDRAMLAVAWVVSIGALVLVVGPEVHSAGAEAWTVLLYALGAGGISLLVDHAVRGMLHSSLVNQALTEVAAHTANVRDWPGGVLPVAALLAQALDAERYAVLARRVGSEEIEPVLTWPPDALWADWHDLVEIAATAFDDHLPTLGSHLVAAPACTEDLCVAVVTPRRSRTDPMDQRVLASTVAGFLAAMADRATLVRRLLEQARTDELTGLPNRRHMFDVLHRELAHAARSDSALSVAMLDLDHFKRYNDRFGHQAGDELLRSFASQFTRRLRAQDTIARYGGEEFLVIMPSTDTKGAALLVRQVAAEPLLGEGGDPVTFSAGIASWDHAEDADRLIGRADAALYRAKAAGRNLVVVADTKVAAPKPAPASHGRDAERPHDLPGGKPR